MKNTTPRQLALLIALVASVLVAASNFALCFINGSHLFLPLLISFVVSFIVVYFTVYYTIHSFIFEKINPIYKTIHNLNIPEKELRNDLEKKDVIREVNNEVIDWARNRKDEIAQLKKMEKYRKEFLGNVMHELRTPIFNIQGYILTLLDGGLEDNTINRSYLERTEKSINRMISIVEDLEAISRLEAGEMKLRFTDFNIVKVFEESFEMHDMLARQMHIKLQFAASYEKPVMVNGDRDRILDAVNNLVNNSIKYGNKKGKTTVTFLDMGENILVEITDTGIGISKENIPRLFERFYRVDKSRSRDQGGTGLGLAIVKHIIEAHNQSINVRSMPEQGTSFAFTMKKALRLRSGS